MAIEFDGQNNKLGTTTANSVVIKTNDTDAVTVDSSQNVSLAGNINLGDNDKAQFGASNDLQLYHNGTNSVIDEQGTGQLLVRSNGDGIFFQNGDSTASIASFRVGTSNEFFYNGAKKLETTSTGATISGDLLITEGTPQIKFTDTDNNADAYIQGSDGNLKFFADDGQENASSNISFSVDGSEKARIDSSGNVGIGTSSPTEKLEVSGDLKASRFYTSTGASGSSTNIPATSQGDGWTTLQFKSQAGTTDANFIEFDGLTAGANQSSSWIGARYNGNWTSNLEFYSAKQTNTTVSNYDSALSARFSQPEITFHTGTAGTSDTSERMRIDSSGNVLVGKTSADSGGSVGTEILSGRVYLRRSGGAALVADRDTSDGDILLLRRAGTNVGIFGGLGSELFLGSNAGSGSYLNFGSNRIIPASVTGGNRDNIIDLGNAASRFDDIYATNGTIQTSDQNEKNTITNSDLGLDFVNRLTPKSYIFNGKTRTHYGLIAQEVETVLSDISKTSTDFAGFIKSDISEEQDGSEYRYGLRYNEFIAPMIKAIQELKADNDALRARIETLENA